MDYKKTLALGAGGAALTAASLAAAVTARFKSKQLQADKEWEEKKYNRLEDIGEVQSLSVLPLIDWYTASDELVGEAGVSYLIKADDTKILFDVGANFPREHPSPLLRNMDALGVSAADVDFVVISHLHLDHVGGMMNERRHTFSLSEGPDQLGAVPAYVPVPMNHPVAECVLSDEPRVIAPGVATTGTISRQLFFMGWTPEQALAINVRGKGIVIVVGCGHQTVHRLIDRTEALFKEPIYGIIGGLHYPVTASRINALGIPLQRILGTGKPPWDPINRNDVESSVSYLEAREPKLVAFSAHDSCNWSVDFIKTRFGESYRELRVGDEIKVS